MVFSTYTEIWPDSVGFERHLINEFMDALVITSAMAIVGLNSGNIASKFSSLRFLNAIRAGLEKAYRKISLLIE